MRLFIEGGHVSCRSVSHLDGGELSLKLNYARLEFIVLIQSGVREVCAST